MVRCRYVLLGGVPHGTRHLVSVAPDLVSPVVFPPPDSLSNYPELVNLIRSCPQLFASFYYLPLEGGPTRSTSPALLLRGLAGSTANIMLLLVLLAVALIFESPAAAYLAIWRGVSALAVTPWSADRPETDASTLRNALALEDKVELQVMREGPERVVKLALTLTQRWKTCIPYWMLIGGLKDPSVSAEGEKVAVFALDRELALVVFPDTRDGTLYLMASGLGAPGEVNCLTRCGSRAYLADDGRESREAGRRAPSC